MISANHAGQYPEIEDAACVHATAVVIGNVRIGHGVFVGPQAVIRSDEPDPEGHIEPIVIEPGANIQDGVIVHALGGSGVRIGKGASVAHGAVVHGPCDVGERSFIGFQSVVFNATLGSGVVLLHQSLVEGVRIPDNIHVPSMTAVRNEADLERLSPVSSELAAFAEKVRRMNRFLAEVSPLGQ
jgi:carbonic anhydrase/acetyltransferase-like protein (isoleucine patch superfamily)